jgi:hypothetical protein
MLLKVLLQVPYLMSYEKKKKTKNEKKTNVVYRRWRRGERGERRKREGVGGRANSKFSYFMN